MTALFGEGRHPDAQRIEADMRRCRARHAGDPGGHPVGDAVLRYKTPATSSGRRCAEAFEAHNAALGVPRDWPVPAEERAAIRTRLAREMFAAEYDRDPSDARELSGFLARVSRQATTSVAGYDLTFSPVKSVSTLWALAPPRDRGGGGSGAPRRGRRHPRVDRGHRDLHPRRGGRGCNRSRRTGLLAAAFTHRDSRAGDPDLHTHVAISNKVQSARDGRWLALDGRPIYKNRVAASERYNTRLEALLRERLGVRFAERARHRGREAAGARDRRHRPGDHRALVRRRAAIDSRRGELAAQFQDRPWPPTDGGRGDRAGAAGQPGDPAG